MPGLLQGQLQGERANHLENSSSKMRENLWERERKEHLATANHSDLPDRGKTKIKQHEIVAAPLM